MSRLTLVRSLVPAAALLADLSRIAFNIAIAAVAVVVPEINARAVAAGLARGTGVAAGPAVVLVR